MPPRATPESSDRHTPAAPLRLLAGILGMRWVHVAAWLAAVLVLSLTPGEYIPKVGFSWTSAAVHVVMYGLLAALLMRALGRPSAVCWAIVTAACGALGAAIELLQIPIPGRYGDVWDALFNVAGAAVAAFAWLLFVKWRAKAF